ncbi:high affinity cGMP-specific 3',5'-cyclic phosphodiesterase 9A isoform X3 [Sitodiplosis mosellana]|nr:high affinity cGMP-specific 3',5'-cyclic phosphodiesterase 9A isoform X3 [Sitodiplosis mosellana]XP_055326826.1 high affinity cGMP-specific 3',5'-cyclic phosphodiesterase 9A isoform X3 [Sitodiplosis mosellana]XP_055326827.1 high affinity cGMP-specific 3',5'-cyclic phosphodiesterase 9A isoform X3 [Sitodiplosis mosellana]XP_055326829.1 high affinity cGMP-specific 3',5'-cyclic phosphodiesterase 9A isoform X3 [Sitodiplosis mosellana]XP_055326830.1 high affinity cGMP-specific 3',5'-cyclic phospho
MYKDNGKINVELLAEVGDIAHRLRSLDKRLALNLNDPRLQHELQQSQTTTADSSDEPTPDHQCSSSERRPSLAAQIAQDIGDRISGGNSAGAPDSEALQQRRYSSKQVEDIILEFYEKHLIYHQNLEKERLVATSTTDTETEPRRSRIFRLTSGDTNNMSNLPSSIASTKCSTSKSGENADSHVNEDSSLTEQTTSKLNELTAEPSKPETTTGSGKRNSIANQPMPEIQISNSDEPPKPRKSLTELFEPKEPTIADSTSNEKSDTYETSATITITTTTTATTTTTTSSSTSPITGGVCGHYCAGWQTSIWHNQLDDDVLRTLVMELKHKIEFTERMNWLLNFPDLSKRPAGPPHRKTSLPKHTEVKKRFMEICDRTFSDEIKAALRLPSFDSYEWEDEDVLFLMQTMFIDTGLVEKFNIPLPTLREWLYEVYKHYNAVPFHNFRHCFCVAQMMYAITCRTNLSARLGDLEVLILLVSCICHDLDHPGYNNIYQINARTELALRYNDISPLENHHCSIAFRLLEHPDCNIFKNFSKETFNQIREGIIRCILATDMARHNEILTQFQEITPTFDYSNEAHINLLCMVLIKVADISNEARPMDIAEPWLERLLQEFFAQSAAEKLEGLPVTPFMDPDKVSKPGSQVRFIGLVLLPLFEALGELLPELVEMIIQPVRDALDFYKKLNDAQNKTRKSLGEVDGSSDGGASPQMPRSQSGISVRSRRSIPSQKSTSRTSVDEPLCISAELHDLPEGSESGDSETATEVDIAEKTSKFKVDTEGNNRIKNVPHTNRKVSREKRPSMISELCTTGSGTRMRGSHGNIHSYHNNRSNFGANRAVSLDQYSTHNRRSSDGLQQVTSDNNVYYNHHPHRSVDGDVPATIAESIQFNKSANDDLSSGGDIRSDPLNRNLKPSDEKSKASQQQQQINQYPQQHKYKILNTASSAANNGTKSFMSRLRQFSSRFSFTFDRDAKRNNSTNASITRNNNANESVLPITKASFCCANKTSSPLHLPAKHMESIHVMPGNDLSARHRAHSLDVVRTRQYSSSNSENSRKSSRNDEHSHIMLMMEDNSNHTTTIGDNKSDADESFSAVCVGGDNGDPGNSI